MQFVKFMKLVKSFLAIFLTLAFPMFVYAQNKPKSWTVAVYINADNDLDSFGVSDVMEMMKVGSNEWMNIIVLIDRYKAPASILYVEKGKLSKIQDLGEVDMGDYRLLIDFATRIYRDFPAERLFLGVWNHGSGWKYKKRKVYKGISYDEQSGNHITTAQLKLALEQITKQLGRKIDVLNFDACLMQMAEVAYVCKDYADYLIASEEVEPGDGAPYFDILSKINNSTIPEELAKIWVIEFVKSYKNGSQGKDYCTQSALNLQKISGLYDAIDGVAKAIMSGNYVKELCEIRENVQSYEVPDNVDLLHLIKLIAKRLKNDVSIKNACNKLTKSMKEVVIANGYSGAKLKNSNGLAIYMPADFKIEDDYLQLDFSKNSLWDEMLLDLYNKLMVQKVVEPLTKGDISKLENFVQNADKYSKSVVKSVIKATNYKLHTEKSIPENISLKVEMLIKKLTEN